MKARPTPVVGEDALVAAALDARERAYAPYSNFSVGAALLTRDGRIFTGCNVENVTFGLTVCAERAAVLKAVGDGCTEFERIVVVTETDPPAAPCGACRQTLAEFADDLEVVLVSASGTRERFRLTELLPRAFTPQALRNRAG